jgi:hypothetical protein
MNDRTTTTFSKKEMGNASYAYMANEGRLAQMDHLWRRCHGNRIGRLFSTIEDAPHEEKDLYPDLLATGSILYKQQ